MLDQFGIMGLQRKDLGLWDYTLFEVWITEISLIMVEIGIIDIEDYASFQNWDYGIVTLLKLELWDYRTPSNRAN